MGKNATFVLNNALHLTTIIRYYLWKTEYITLKFEVMLSSWCQPLIENISILPI